MSLPELPGIPEHLLRPMVPGSALPVLDIPGDPVLPEPEPEPKTETSYILLGLRMYTTHPDGGLGDPYGDRNGMLEREITVMPLGHHIDPAAAAAAAYALFGEPDVDQVQVRPLINGKADGYESWWISEDKESYNDRSARDGVARPVFGKDYVTINDARDGGVDLLALMMEDK